MSQPLSPYAAAPPPPKPRPSVGWFVLGGGLLVAAVAVGVTLFAWALSGFLGTDGRVAADGQTHRITVGTDRDRMLWLEDPDQVCTVVDARDGSPITLRLASGRFERSDGDLDLRGTWRFDPGSGRLDITCDTLGTDATRTAVVSPVPRIGSFVVGLLLGILVPAFLGLAGLVVLVVTTVLFATRPPRPRRAEA